jgi:CHAT domain-containing protein/Tfp pilus assembly protein PilF
MRGSRKQRLSLSTYSVAIAAIILSGYGCSNEARRDPAALYDRAERLRRASNIPEALRITERGLSAWRGRLESQWYWRFRVMKAEILLGQNKAKDALELLREAPPRNLPDRDAIDARRLADLGYAAFLDSQAGPAKPAASRWAEARDLYDQAYQAAQRPAAREVLPRVLMFRAILHIELEEYERAESEVRDAFQAAEAARDRYMQSVSSGELGVLLLRRHHYDEAIRAVLRSLEISTSEGFVAAQMLSFSNLGWCYYRLGDFEKAESYLRQAETVFARLGRTPDRETAIDNLGNVRYAQQDYRGALQYYEQALALAEKMGSATTETAWALSHLTKVHLELGDLRTAQACNARARDLESRLRDSDLNGWVLGDAAEIDFARRDYPAAAKAYRDALVDVRDPNLQWEAHAGLGRIYMAQGDWTRARAEFEQAAGILDTNWSELLNDSSKLTFQVRAMRLYHAYVDFLVAHVGEREALEFVESRRARLLAQETAARPGPAPPGGFQGLARQTGTVLFSYWLGPERSYLWVAAPGGVRTLSLPPEGRIRELVERYSQAVTEGRDTAATLNPAGRELYHLLVEPAAGLLKKGARVVLVPDGCLHGLNFETLLTPAGKYWLEDATVEIAPSLRLYGRARAASRAQPSILLIGDPVQEDPSLPPLPHAAAEIAGISSLFRDKLVLTGAAARPDAYRTSGPGRFSVVHFAAHAVPNRENPLDSAVVLSGRDASKLYAWEVSKVPLDADLVTVSACKSAGARAYAGEGLVGFAWAFLAAGARNVVASLWDVNDESTADFMKSLYQELRRGQAPAAALRDVKLRFVHSQTNRGKPYYWAPFQLYVR